MAKDAMQTRQLYWLAINGPSVAASAVPFTVEQMRKGIITPRPQQLIGLPGRLEQLDLQRFLITAPVSEIEERFRQWRKREDIAVVTLENPDPPTGSDTLWLI
jgi:hypothetical protein